MIDTKTYKDYKQYMKAFKEKQLNLLVVVSRGGLGKTFISEEELLEEAPLVFTGHVTPMSMYKELYLRHQEEEDFLVIFDDVDALMLNKTNIALLKQLCDTREIKQLKYSTTSHSLHIPKEFNTKCKVLMLMNDLNPKDPNLKALMSRAHLINFIPSDTEILANIRTFGEDKEILDFISVYAPFSKTLNLRVYKRAIELKEAKLDWHSTIINELNVDPLLLEVHQLLSKYKTDKERDKKFSGGRATYYRKKKLLLSKNVNLKTI